MLNPDFKDMLSALSAEDVDYMVVGAYAMAAHGYPRATGDLDIWIRADSDTAPRAIAAIARFGAPLHDLTIADLSVPGIVFQIGVAPGRIDILTGISGVEFDTAWERRIVAELEELDVPVLGLEDLIINKRATGRAKDLLDAERLEEDGS